MPVCTCLKKWSKSGLSSMTMVGGGGDGRWRCPLAPVISNCFVCCSSNRRRVSSKIRSSSSVWLMSSSDSACYNKFISINWIWICKIQLKMCKITWRFRLRSKAAARVWIKSRIWSGISWSKCPWSDWRYSITKSGISSSTWRRRNELINSTRNWTHSKRGREKKNEITRGKSSGSDEWNLAMACSMSDVVSLASTASLAGQTLDVGSLCARLFCSSRSRRLR